MEGNPVALSRDQGVEEIGMGRALKQGQTSYLAASFPGGRKAGRASRGSQAPEEAKRSS